MSWAWNTAISVVACQDVPSFARLAPTVSVVKRAFRHGCGAGVTCGDDLPIRTDIRSPGQAKRGCVRGCRRRVAESTQRRRRGRMHRKSDVRATHATQVTEQQPPLPQLCDIRSCWGHDARLSQRGRCASCRTIRPRSVARLASVRSPPCPEPVRKRCPARPRRHRSAEAKWTTRARPGVGSRDR